MTQKTFVIAALIVLSFSIIACGNKTSDETAQYGDGKIAWEELDTAGKSAQLHEKKLFIYFHTDWCSWCKRMETETFANDSVAEYVNTNFIAVTIDAESKKQITFNGNKMSMQELASTLGVQGFPTHVFLDSGGEPITLTPGFMPAERFLEVLSYIAEDHYKTTEWEVFMQNRGG
jgi:thioredoxin-related protein